MILLLLDAFLDFTSALIVFISAPSSCLITLKGFLKTVLSSSIKTKAPFANLVVLFILKTFPKLKNSSLILTLVSLVLLSKTTPKVLENKTLERYINKTKKQKRNTIKVVPVVYLAIKNKIEMITKPLAEKRYLSLLYLNSVNINKPYKNNKQINKILKKD